MKWLILFILSLSQLYASAPFSDKIGPVAVSVEDGSVTEIALEAVRKPYTEDWLESYTSDPIMAGESLTPSLSAALPLSNPIAGMEKDGTVELYDLGSGKKVALFFQDGRIKAASSYIPESPEL